MENFEEKACLCALNRIFGFEPKIGLALISHLGSAAEVFRLGEDGINSLLGPYSRYRGKINRLALDKAAEELEMLGRQGTHFCGITGDDYPRLLGDCEDAPIGLYVRTSTPLPDLWEKCGLGVVGTRDISLYGKEWCRKLVEAVSYSAQRPAIISGLALGVDIEAHRTALDCGLPTIAVMATGPETIYPYRHRSYAERIASTPGCALITDYPPGTAPLAIHFIRRNRIIAGLSDSVLLIESRVRGGGMMTCRLAFSYNRDVYALPGRADDPRSGGCNELIYKKIAEPVISVASFTESLGLSVRKTAAPHTDRLRSFYSSRLGKDDLDRICAIASLIRKSRGITVEDIASSLPENYAKTAELAGMLEIDGFINTDLLRRCSINPKNM